MSLLKDWKVYVDDPSSFDKHHFGSLMAELETSAQMHDAFDDLPSGRSFSDRLIDLRNQADFSGSYLVPYATAVSGDALQMAETYRDNVFDYLRELGDPEAEVIAANPIVEISMTAYRSGKKAGSLGRLQATWTIDDNYIDYMYEHPRWIRGLREAVFMMTTIPEVTRYLLAPIVKFPLDDSPAAALWLRGYRVDFAKIALC